MAAKTPVKNTKFMVSTGPKQGATSQSITSITAANPPLVTTPTAHGFLSGAAIELKNTGDESLDGPYAIEVVSDTSFYLSTADWSNRSALSGVSLLTATELNLSQFCDITSISIDDLEVSYDTSHTLCDEINEAQVTNGTIGADANWLPATLLQQVLSEYHQTQEKFILLIRPPKLEFTYAWRVMQSKFSPTGDASDTKYTVSLEWKVDSRRSLIDLS